MQTLVKWSYRFLVFLCLLILAWRFGNWEVKRSAPPLPALPQPNGYTELLAAAADLKLSEADLGDLAPEQVRRLADQNRPVIERARKALAMDSEVTLQPTMAWHDHHENEIASLRHLAVAFSLEDRVQWLGQHTNDAARCDLDTLRLAESMRRGGLIIDGIHSLVAEAIAVASLRAKLPQLDSNFCRDAAAQMEALNARRELPATTFATDNAWSMRRYGLIAWFGNILTRQANARGEAKYLSRSQEAIDRFQKLMIRLAARAYELDNGSAPPNVGALVPRYLKAIPKDARTGKEIVEVTNTAGSPDAAAGQQ